MGRYPTLQKPAYDHLNQVCWSRETSSTRPGLGTTGVMGQIPFELEVYFVAVLSGDRVV